MLEQGITEEEFRKTAATEFRSIALETIRAILGEDSPFANQIESSDLRPILTLYFIEKDYTGSIEREEILTPEQKERQPNLAEFNKRVSVFSLGLEGFYGKNGEWEERKLETLEVHYFGRGEGWYSRFREFSIELCLDPNNQISGAEIVLHGAEITKPSKTVNDKKAEGGNFLQHLDDICFAGPVGSETKVLFKFDRQGRLIWGNMSIPFVHLE